MSLGWWMCMDKLDMNGESNYIDENFEPNYSENEYSISTEEGISANILEQKTFNQLKEGKKNELQVQ